MHYVRKYKVCRDMNIEDKTILTFPDREVHVLLLLLCRANSRTLLLTPFALRSSPLLSDHPVGRGRVDREGSAALAIPSLRTSALRMCSCSLALPAGVCSFGCSRNTEADTHGDAGTQERFQRDAW